MRQFQGNMSKLRLSLEPHERKTMIELVALREVATAEKECADKIQRARHAACEFYAMTVIQAHKLDFTKWRISDDLEGFVERKPREQSPSTTLEGLDEQGPKQ